MSTPFLVSATWNDDTYLIGINDESAYKHNCNVTYMSMLHRLHEVYASLKGIELLPDEPCPYEPQELLDLIEAEEPDYETRHRVETILDMQDALASKILLDITHHLVGYLDR